MTDQEIRLLWGAFEQARNTTGDATAKTLLKAALKSAFLEGVRHGVIMHAGTRNMALVDRRQIDIDLDIERWWSSIGISEQYAPPSLAFFCFEKAIGLIQQKGMRAVQKIPLPATESTENPSMKKIR